MTDVDLRIDAGENMCHTKTTKKQLDAKPMKMGNAEKENGVIISTY